MPGAGAAFFPKHWVEHLSNVILYTSPIACTLSSTVVCTDLAEFLLDLVPGKVNLARHVSHLHPAVGLDNPAQKTSR